MGYNNIQQLLEKYWEGDTSVKEEKALKDFFNHGNVPQEFEEYKPLFQYYEYESKLKLDDDFENMLLAEIESMPNNVVSFNRRKRTVVMIRRIAAVALIALSVGLGYNYFSQEPTVVAQTITLDDLTEEERLQYEQTKAALVYVSQKLNRGASLAATGVVKVHKSTEKVRNQR